MKDNEIENIKEDLCALAVVTYNSNRRSELGSFREKALWDLGERVECCKNELMYSKKVEMISYEI